MQRNVSKSVLQVQEVLLFFLVIAKVTKVALMKSNERNICHWDAALRACLHGVGDPGLVGLVSFVFTLWGTQNKRNLPH